MRDLQYKFQNWQACSTYVVREAVFIFIVSGHCDQEALARWRRCGSPLGSRINGSVYQAGQSPSMRFCAASVKSAFA